MSKSNIAFKTLVLVQNDRRNAIRPQLQARNESRGVVAANVISIVKHLRRNAFFGGVA